MHVTVGISFFNSAPTLRWAVQSVIAQSFESWELILVDDGSTDDSIESISGIADSRIRLIRDGKRLGLAKRLNQMVALARGEYFARMDADDLMFPERLERQYAILSAPSNDVDILASAIVSIDCNNVPIGVRELKASRITACDILGRGGIVHPTVMGKTSWFRENLYSSNFPRAEDRELWARTISHSGIYVMSEPLLFYREVGLGDPQKILTGYASERRIIRLYGKSLVGGLRSAELIIRSLVKSFAIGGPWGKRMLRFMEIARSTHLSEQEAKRFGAIIQAILASSLRSE